MSEESIILQVLGQFRADVDKLTSAVGEVKAELVGVTLQMAHIVQRMDVANGRTGKLEARVDAIERHAIHADGVADGKREQREAYWRWTHSLWEAVWSTPGRIVGALALLSAGWTLREMASLGEVWPW